MEAAAQQVQQGLENLVKELDAKHVRPAQKQVFLNSAKCCDSAGEGQESLQRCLSKCQQPVAQMEQVVTAQLGQFQERMQRCMVRCQDLASDSLPASPSEKQMAAAKAEVEKCVTDCAKQYAGQIPKLRSDILASLKKI
mmetsp:Transcript_20704/g.53035  ORF Transcript_20704/g.53035 Transcript_20704/m.53035 type:complete len:139 (-) Transcript_20704:308-724(-)|eukprot:jgi/Tetstr1/421852/TSEL_012752.t1